MSKTKPTSIYLPNDVLDRLQAIADRHNISRNAVIARFISAGIEANPEATAAEIGAARARRTGAMPRGAGLVIPLPPLARVEQEKSGGEDGIVRRDCTPDLVVLYHDRDRRAA